MRGPRGPRIFELRSCSSQPPRSFESLAVEGGTYRPRLAFLAILRGAFFAFFAVFFAAFFAFLAMPWLLYVAALAPLNERTMSRRNKIATEKIPGGEFATTQRDSKTLKCDSHHAMTRMRCEALGAGMKHIDKNVIRAASRADS